MVYISESANNLTVTLSYILQVCDRGPPFQPPQANFPTYHIKGQPFSALTKNLCIRQNKLEGADSPKRGVNLRDAGLVAHVEEQNEGEKVLKQAGHSSSFSSDADKGSPEKIRSRR